MTLKQASLSKAKRKAPPFSSGRKKMIKTNKTLSELLSKLTPSQRADLRHKIKMLEVEAELAKRKPYISKPLVKGGGVKLYKSPRQEVKRKADYCPNCMDLKPFGGVKVDNLKDPHCFDCGRRILGSVKFKPPQQEVKGWEMEFRLKMAEIIGREGKFAMNSMVKLARHLLEADRKAIRERIIEKLEEMKNYYEWASKRDNEIYDKTIDQVINVIKEVN